MFCMVVIIATLPAQCKSFFLIPKKIMGFSDNQEIFLEKSTFLLSFVCVFAGFSQISSKKSFSRKKYPLPSDRGYVIKFDNPEKCFLPRGFAAGTEKAVCPSFPEIFWKNN